MIAVEIIFLLTVNRLSHHPVLFQQLNLKNLNWCFNHQAQLLKLLILNLQVFSNCLRSSGRTGIIASEEEDVPVAVEESYSGNYIVVFDPLDGSSNIDAAVSTGSIFGIYSPNDECLADIGDGTTVRENSWAIIISVSLSL